MRHGWLLAAALSIAVTCPARAEDDMGAAYARAARVLDANLADAIRNREVVPHWIGTGDRFWYRRDGGAGPEWVIVDSSSGKRSPAFDTMRLRAAALEALGSSDLPGTLPVSSIDLAKVTLSFRGKTVECETTGYICTARAQPSPTPDTLWAADGRHGVVVRNDNLWLRTKGQPGDAALTRDGVAHFSYGASPGTSLFAVPRMRSTAPVPPFGIAWSPDGTRFISDRVDERAVKPYPFVEWVPQDGSWRPKLWEPRIPLLGDAERSIVETAVFDIASARKTPVTLPDGWRFYTAAFSWSADGRRAFGLATTRAAEALALVETDLETGKVRFVVREDTPAWGRFNSFVYSPPNVRVLEGSREVIWFSERDGWGQLYLYDLASGRLKRKLTAGARTVRDLIGVDEKRRRLYFTAGGTDADADPYLVRLYSVSLDGGAPKLLSPEPAVHLVRRAPVDNRKSSAATPAGLSPDGNWIVESYSTLDEPPVSVLRSAADGRVIATLETAEVGRVVAAGWKKPVRVKTVSADGKTPLWGTVYFPPNPVPGRKYPVIDAIYGGPQVTNAPADYIEAVATANPRARASLAELGFIVLTIDGRGTPGRSKAFNNASYKAFAGPELADHVAGIKQLAARFGNFDLDRVGIYGHSFGGYTSARGILTYPDFYKVAVSSAGPHNFQGFYPVEGMFPKPDFGNGRADAPTSTAVPDVYADLDLLPLASRLKGKLLLAYGDLDENALPAVTLQLVDALTKANKPYDLMYLPNRDHNFFRTDAYYTQRMWDYFVEHLQHREPPRDFTLKLAPPVATSGF
jgi:dipeptidyl-peptidase-4